MTNIEQNEFDAVSRHGVIHLRTWARDDAEVSIEHVLVLLHPMPHDGAFFSAIAPLLAIGRTVVAPDYPGYGKSQALEPAPTIGLYADAMIDALRDSGFRGPYDFFGFHTIDAHRCMQIPGGTDNHRVKIVTIHQFLKGKIVTAILIRLCHAKTDHTI